MCPGVYLSIHPSACTYLPTCLPTCNQRKIKSFWIPAPNSSLFSKSFPPYACLCPCVSIEIYSSLFALET